MSEPLPAPVSPLVPSSWDAVMTWAVPTCWLVAGVVVGIIVERVLLGRLKAWSEKSGWGYDSVLINGVKGVAFFWCLVLSVSATT